MKRIQVPTISRDLVRLLELTEAPELGLEESVTPVLVVGTLGGGAAAEGGGFYSPVGPASSRVYDLYGNFVEINAGAGVSGYSALVNPDTSNIIFHVTRVKASSPVAQEFSLNLYQPGHGIALGFAAIRRDSRALVPTPGGGGSSTVANKPAGGSTVFYGAPQTHCDFDGYDLVLGPGAAAVVTVLAFAQRYDVSWAFTAYRA